MRLIDADALLAFIDVGHLRNPNELCFSELSLKELLDNQPTISPCPDWTPCADGTNLPRFGETVLVTVEFESGSRIVFQAYRKWTIFQSWFWVYSNDNRCWQKVIAWKRQEPYNPDRKEDAKSDDVSQWPEWKQRAALSNYELGKED